MTLRPLTLDECQQVRQWRNDLAVLPMLRTKAPITEAQQAAFYRDVVTNPESDHRYYAIEHRGGAFAGMGGLTYLSRAPGEAEISLILSPVWRGFGLGPEAVRLLLVEARRLRLRAVTGECYKEGPQSFWLRVIPRMPCLWEGATFPDGTLCWKWTL